MFSKLHPSKTSGVIGCAYILAASTAYGQVLTAQHSGPNSNAAMGTSLSGGGDVNGDGFEDLIVGTPGFTNAFGVPGSATVYSGKDLTTRIWDRVPFELDSKFGTAVAIVGDVDLDGHADFAVGAPAYATSKGHVVVYSGGTGDLIWEQFGSSATDELGAAIAAAGDINHDGSMDVLVGAPGVDTAYVLGWNPAAPGPIVLLAVSGAASSRFGQALSGGLDMNADATSDFIVGAPDRVHTFQVGSVTAVSGVDGSNLLEVFGWLPFGQFGLSVAQLGDVSGDGKSKFAVGVPRRGEVHVFDSAGVLHYTVSSFFASTFGRSVARLPDINGDSLPDFVVGAPDDSWFGGNGRVYAFRGTDGTELFECAPPGNSYAEFGTAVAGGNWNGDAFGDVAVGDPERDVGGWSNAGQVDIYLGCPASWENYGAGWPGTLGIPNFVALNDPGIGQTLQLHLDNSAGGNTSGFLFVGFASTAVLTSAGGTLLVVPTLSVPIGVPAVGLTLQGTIPNDPALCFLELYLQAIEYDTGASNDLSFTPGLKLFIGFDMP